MLVKGIALHADAGSFQPPEGGILLWSREMRRAVFVIAYVGEYSARRKQTGANRYAVCEIAMRK